MELLNQMDGVFAEMQIISYNFIILKRIQINSQFRNWYYAESPIHLIGWDNLYTC